MNTRIQIEGMECEACVAHIEKTLEAVPSVDSVTIELGRGQASVEHHGADEQKLLAAVKTAGYEARILPA